MIKKHSRIVAIVAALSAISLLLASFSGCVAILDSGSLDGTWSTYGGAGKLSYEFKKTGECTYTLVNFKDLLEYYWTDSDAEFHIYEDCGKLNQATILYNGVLSSATENGKTGCCADCTERYIKSNPDTIETHISKGTWEATASVLKLTFDNDLLTLRYELNGDKLTIYDQTTLPDGSISESKGVFYRE